MKVRPEGNAQPAAKALSSIRVVDPVNPRRRLGRYLTGSGIEVGPGHHPFPLVVPRTSVRYVDRWNPAENEELFPEINGAEFPRPDIIANFDDDLLTALCDQAQDFVICSHVLEHLANPLVFLGEIYRVLVPGGLALILLPDRHRTFDHRRAPTPLSHLVADYEAKTTEVDQLHVEDFLLMTSPESARAWREASPAERQQMVDWHRNRSIHVHCWDEQEFCDVLLYAIEHLGQKWEFVDGLLTDEGGPDAIEFGYVLRRACRDVPTADAVGRFTEASKVWRADTESILAAGTALRAGTEPGQLERQVHDDEMRQKDEEIARLRSELVALHGTKLFRCAAPLRRAYARLRSINP